MFTWVVSSHGGGTCCEDGGEHGRVSRCHGHDDAHILPTIPFDNHKVTYIIVIIHVIVSVYVSDHVNVNERFKNTKRLGRWL